MNNALVEGVESLTLAQMTERLRCREGALSTSISAKDLTCPLRAQSRSWSVESCVVDSPAGAEVQRMYSSKPGALGHGPDLQFVHSEGPT